MGPGGAGDDPGQGRLADPWWAMEEEVADAIGGDGAAEQSPGSENRLLAGDIIEAAGSEPIGEGGQPSPLLFAMVTEEVDVAVEGARSISHHTSSDSLAR